MGKVWRVAGDLIQRISSPALPSGISNPNGRKGRDCRERQLAGEEGQKKFKKKREGKIIK